MPKKLMWMAVTPDRYEQIIHIEDSAKALAYVMGLKPQTVRRQKWYWEHKAVNASYMKPIEKYRIKTILMEDE